MRILQCCNRNFFFELELIRLRKKMQTQIRTIMVLISVVLILRIFAVNAPDPVFKGFKNYQFKEKENILK